MKQGTRPNRKQKGILQFHGMNLNDYLFLRYEDGFAVFVHRRTHEILRLEA